LRGSLVEIGKGDTFLKIHARAEDEAILHRGFDRLLKKLSACARTPPSSCYLFNGEFGQLMKSPAITNLNMTTLTTRDYSSIN